MFDFKHMQKKWQKKWEDNNIFEANPNKNDKFFMTVPYPYISGSLHIGHARVVTEADVITRYQRMFGKNVLFPIAFHISGTPVLGISLAIQSKDKKMIDLYKGYIKKYIEKQEEVDKIIESFKEPQNIVDFFIPKMIDEFKTLGLSVDWRRSYTSGDIEHQALVEWQFRKYKKKNYLVQGKYPILFSKTLNNAVGEDDIKEGDTNPVEMQEFTLLKFKFQDSFIIAGTIRPETIYGQTNMWIDPDVEYIKAEVNGEKWIATKEFFDKLTFQDRKVKILEKIVGIELLGKYALAPGINREIIILPSKFCKPYIGSGIVTSVPGHASFDWIGIYDLQKNAELCYKYKLNFYEICKIKPISIIKVDGWGDFPAVEICQKMNIQSQKEIDKLEEAKKEIYKAEHHTGIMKNNCGKYSGMPVEIAKNEVKKDLIKEGMAENFYETSRKALSRDGGEVIVAILDNQWFLDFNSKGWKDSSKRDLQKMEIWPEKYRKQFEDVFDWLDKRPCARLRGLGTKLPFNKDWVIESLSDSTIYMALYPIIHLMRELNFKKGQMTDEFFDYVFNSEGQGELVAKQTGIHLDSLRKIQSEWNYWYPFDQRHTFNAHLSNHLSFMIFAHNACFEEKHRPKKITLHGMILSGGEKMSKSKGNVVSLLDINEKFGADSYRAFMCSSTSVESTFNWESDKIENVRKQLDVLFSVLYEIQSSKENNTNYENYKSFVSKTERCVKRCTEALERMDLREYSTIILYEMLSNYRKISKSCKKEDIKSVNNYVGNIWVKLISPLIPHIAEELWESGNNGFVSSATWPSYDSSLIDEEAEFMADSVENLRSDIMTVLKLAKIEKPSKITIIISSKWKYLFFKMFKEILTQTRNPGDIFKKILVPELKPFSQEITKLVPSLLKDSSKIPLVITSQEEEMNVLSEATEVLMKEFDCEIDLILAEDSKEDKAKNANPSKPAVLVE